MAGELILVVDDEELIRELVSHCLTKDGFRVLTADDAYSVFELVSTQKPDLIILDILLPGIDGIEACRILRQETNIPIIFLTSKNEKSDVILGLGVGGDDYITKPFAPGELSARVKAHLRRYTMQSSPGVSEEPKQLTYPGLAIDLEGRTVKVNGTPVVLAPKEFELLAMMAKSPNRVFRNEQLLELVWQSKDFIDHRTLPVHISRLRKKIEKDPANPVYILTARGVGYKFNAFDQ